MKPKTTALAKKDGYVQMGLFMKNAIHTYDEMLRTIYTTNAVMNWTLFQSEQIVVCLTGRKEIEITRSNSLEYLQGLQKKFKQGEIPTIIKQIQKVKEL